MALSRNFSGEGFKRLAAFIDKFADKQSALIEVLHEAQHIFGYLSQDAMLFISEKLHIPASKIFGVVSFYSFFTTEPKGRTQFKVCLGTACFVRGAERVSNELQKQLGLNIGQTSDDQRYSLESVRCVGACGLAPVVMVNDKVYGRLSVSDIGKIIKDID